MDRRRTGAVSAEGVPLPNTPIVFSCTCCSFHFILSLHSSLSLILIISHRVYSFCLQVIKTKWILFLSLDDPLKKKIAQRFFFLIIIKSF